MSESSISPGGRGIGLPLAGLGVALVAGGYVVLAEPPWVGTDVGWVVLTVAVAGLAYVLLGALSVGRLRAVQSIAGWLFEAQKPGTETDVADLEGPAGDGTENDG